MPRKTKAKHSVRQIHAVISTVVAEYKGEQYCVCPTCRNGHVIINAGAFENSVDCAKSIHYLTELDVEHVIDERHG